MNSWRVMPRSRMALRTTNSGIGSTWVWKTMVRRKPDFIHISWPPAVRKGCNPKRASISRNSLTVMFESFFITYAIAAIRIGADTFS